MADDVIRTVYVAGPLGSRCDWAANVGRACAVADQLVELGFVPFVPHLSVAWVASTYAADRRPYESWMEWCLEWVARCDAVYRMPGESPGADREVAHARSLGIPVVDFLERVQL